MGQAAVSGEGSAGHRLRWWAGEKVRVHSLCKVESIAGSFRVGRDLSDLERQIKAGRRLADRNLIPLV